MSIPLPSLPEPFSDMQYCRPSGVFGRLAGYTADQLRARDKEIVRCVLEAAETACGHLAQADAVASIIRALEFRHE